MLQRKSGLTDPQKDKARQLLTQPMQSYFFDDGIPFLPSMDILRPRQI
jgi:hypothetical protein